MAIPSEYDESPLYSGATNMNTPVYGIYGLIRRNQEESVGPITNLRTGTVLHPDMHDTDPDRGRTNAAQHQRQFSTFLPGEKCGSNFVRRGDATSSLDELMKNIVYIEGEAGTYMKAQYYDNQSNPVVVAIKFA